MQQASLFLYDHGMIYQRKGVKNYYNCNLIILHVKSAWRISLLNLQASSKENEKKDFISSHSFFSSI